MSWIFTQKQNITTDMVQLSILDYTLSYKGLSEYLFAIVFFSISSYL